MNEFFSASTCRWKVMKDILEPLGQKVVKDFSETRWSADMIVSALFDCSSHIKSALFLVAENLDQKIEIRATAKGLLNKINISGFAVLLCFWKTILQYFNKNQFFKRSEVRGPIAEVKILL